MKLHNKAGEEIKSLDLGVVEAGKSKEFEYELFNETSAQVTEIVVEIVHQEVEVLSFPKELQPKAKGTVKIKWSPSITIKKGLQTLVNIKGTELYSNGV